MIARRVALALLASALVVALPPAAAFARVGASDESITIHVRDNTFSPADRRSRPARRCGG